MNKSRKIFFVMASGGHDTERHYSDTIKNKRSADEAANFLEPGEAERLRKIYLGRSFAVWGAVPGSGNIRTWEGMEEGDYVMIYRKGKIILAAEVAMKVHNPALAKNYWRVDEDGRTWEYIFFLINEVEVNVGKEDLNKYMEYAPNYNPQGFMAVRQDKADKLLSLYGDLISFLIKIQNKEEPEKIEIEKKQQFEEIVDEQVEKAPSEHSEMQWRLIRLGNKCHFDVWVPRADQGKEYNGQLFRDLVIPEFHEALDIPIQIKNIDTVWKLGLSVKSAFEIEHSTSVYSGILRLSDLRALAPNSNYPLFIVADRNRRAKVFEQVKRPTFTNDFLHLDKVIKFLSYDKLRELDETLKNGQAGFDINWLTQRAEAVS